MKYLVKFLVCAFCVWVCPLLPMALDGELQVVGWLQEVDGDLEDITLIRGNTRVPVAFFMELHEGDKLIIDKSEYCNLFSDPVSSSHQIFAHSIFRKGPQ